MSPIDVLAALLLMGGGMLGIGGGIGLLRFPDFYTRLHAAGITDTLCAGLFLAGLALQFGWSLATAKLLMIFAFLMFTSPTACNALANTAWRAGLAPWTAPDATGRK